jgi:hypothetical protein
VENPKHPPQVNGSVIAQMVAVLGDQKAAQKERGCTRGYVLDGFSLEQLEKIGIFLESFRASEITAARELQSKVFATIERFFMKQSEELRDMVLRESEK